MDLMPCIMRLWYVLYTASFIRQLYSEALYRTTTSSNASIQSSRPTSPPNAVIGKGLACLEHSFNFTIQFERPFSGMIFTEGAELAHCVYVEGWKDSRTQYQFLIPMDSCGSTTTRNETLYQTTNTFLVQRDPKLIELNDNAFTVVCQRYYPTSLDDSPIGAITMIYERFEVEGPTEEVVTKEVNEIVGREVQFGTRLALGDDPEGPVPEKPVALGERLTYVFYCSANDSTVEKKDCTVGECIATDPTGTRRVQLSDQNGCTKHPAVWSNFFAHSANFGNGIEAQKVLLARLSAWSFPTSTHVLISCRARSCDGACSGGPSSCALINASGTNPGFELASTISDISLVNDTSAFKHQLANDAVERPLSLDDAVVGYKVDRSNAVPIGPLCQTQQPNAEKNGLSQPEMITAQSPRLLSPVPILPPTDTDSGQFASRSANNALGNRNNRKCVSMDVFVGLVSSLLIGLGIMTFAVAYLMWKLHKCQKRVSVVRIEKRTVP